MNAKQALSLNRIEESVNSLLRSWLDTGDERLLADCSELETEYKKRTGRPCPICRTTILYMTGG